jgi:hypothetical protein
MVHEKCGEGGWAGGILCLVSPLPTFPTTTLTQGAVDRNRIPQSVFIFRDWNVGLPKLNAGEAEEIIIRITE